MYKYIVTILITIFLLADIASASEPMSILVVAQEDNLEYKAACDSFVKAMKAADLEIETVSCSDFDNEGINYLKFDLFVVIGSKAALSVKSKAPRGVAIAYCMVYSPDDIGLTAEEQNFGVSLSVSIKDQLALIKKVIPDVKTVATMVGQSRYSNKKWPVSQWPDSHGYPMVVVPDEIESQQRAGYVSKLIDLDPDCIWSYPDSNVFHSISIRLLLLECIKRRIPVFGYSEKVVKAGALFGVSVDPADQGIQLSEMVIEYSRDKKLDVSHITAKFSPVFNLAVAEIINITIPQDVLSQARYVYGK